MLIKVICKELQPQVVYVLLVPFWYFMEFKLKPKFHCLRLYPSFNHILINKYQIGNPLTSSNSDTDY